MKIITKKIKEETFLSIFTILILLLFTNSIKVKWNYIESGIPINYQIRVTDQFDNTVMILNTEANSDWLVDKDIMDIPGLVVGNFYKFYVASYDMNGNYSHESDPLIAQECIKPIYFISKANSNLIAMVISLETITVSFQPPDVLGGCSITKYILYYSNPDGNELVNYTTVLGTSKLETSINITNPANSVGKVFFFQIEAVNPAGSVRTEIISIILGLPPVDEPPPLTINENLSDSKIICLAIPGLPGTYNSGGLPIISNEVQIQYGDGAYTTISGVPPHYNTSNSFCFKDGDKSINLSIGITYTFRFRTWNVLGNSPYSQETEYILRTIPLTPSVPSLLSQSTTKITLNLEAALVFSGEAITTILYGTLGINNTEVEIYRYNGILSTFIIDKTAFNIVEGTIYSFRQQTQNTKGLSSYSEYLSVMALSTFAKITDIQVNYFDSTLLDISWSVSNLQTTSITGYMIYIDNNGNNEFTLIGQTIHKEATYLLWNYSSSSAFIIRNNPVISPGIEYNIKIIYQSIDNVPGSLVKAFVFCNKIQNFETLTIVSESSTGVFLNWENPKILGGCLLKSASLVKEYNDIEVITPLSSTNTFLYSEAFSPADLGKTFYYSILVTNTIFSLRSNKVEVNVLDTPIIDSSKQIRQIISTKTSMTIEYDEPTISNPQEEVQSYIVYRDNGNTDPLFAFIGAENTEAYPNLKTTLVIDNLTPRKVYRFKYKAINIMGFSQTSDIFAFTTGEIPGVPPRPQLKLISFSSATITMQMPIDDGGMDITNYLLFYNDCINSTLYTAVSSYDFSINGLTAVIPNTSLTPNSNNTYCLFALAENAKGTSPGYSEALKFTYLSLPPSLANLALQKNLSSNNTLLFNWTALTDPSFKLLYYSFEIFDFTSNKYSAVYQGTNAFYYYAFTEQLRGKSTTAVVYAVNFYGKGSISNTLDFNFCSKPLQMQTPKITYLSNFVYSVSWNHPNSDGGCSVISYYLRRNDGGNNSNLNTVVNNSLIENNINAFQTNYVLDDPSLKGKLVKFNVSAKNIMGETASSYTEFLIGGIPLDPTAAVGLTYLGNDTLTREIRVSIPYDISNQANFNGSPIAQIIVEVKSTAEVNYSVVSASLVKILYLKAPLFLIKLGETYTFRYKVANGFGESAGYSPESSVNTSSMPQINSSQSALSIVSFNATQVTLLLTVNLIEPNGSNITAHYLKIYDFAKTTELLELSFADSVISVNPEVQIIMANYPVLLPGKFYLATYQVMNSVGLSEESNPVKIIFGQIPVTPVNAPTNNILVTTDSNLNFSLTDMSTSISITGGSPITFYSVQIRNISDNPLEPFAIASSLLQINYNIGFYMNASNSKETITKGKVYEVRYNANNYFGGTDYSPSVKIKAMEYPSQPAPARISSITDSLCGFSLYDSLDNGGDDTISFNVFIRQFNDQSTSVFLGAFPKLGFAPLVYSVSVNRTLLGLDKGRLYELYYNTQNSKGVSIESAFTIFSFLTNYNLLVLKPFVKSISNTTASITWDEVPDGVLPGDNVLGYSVMLRERSDINYSLTDFSNASLYEESIVTTQTTALIANLNPGSIYSVFIKIRYYFIIPVDTVSDSLIATFVVCPLPPVISDLKFLNLLLPSPSSTIVNFTYTTPVTPVNCPVTQTKVFLAKYSDIGSQQIDNIVYIDIPQSAIQFSAFSPSQTLITITGYFDQANELGDVFLVKLETTSDPSVFLSVFNLFSSLDYNYLNYSEVSAFLLATVPAKPSPMLFHWEFSSTTMLVVETPDQSNSSNGSALESYEVYIDDGLGGAFSVIPTQDPLQLYFKITMDQALLTQIKPLSFALKDFIKMTIVPGRLYRLNYRVKNALGFSDFSETLLAKGSDRPSKPKAPGVTFLSDSQIQLSLDNPYNGESPITLYEVYIKKPSETVFSSIFSENSFQSTLTLNDPDYSGVLYEIYYIVKNSKGYSEPSNLVGIGFTPVPSPVTGIELSKITSKGIEIKWVNPLPGVGETGKILGYTVFITHLDALSNQPGVLLLESFEINDTSVNTFFYNTTTNTSIQGYITVHNALRTSQQTLFSFEACLVPHSPYLSIFPLISPGVIQVNWNFSSLPLECAIESFSVFIDDGMGNAFSEVSDSAFANSPLLRNYEISGFKASDLGKSFRINIKAKSIKGESAPSNTISAVYANRPVQPQPITADPLDLIGSEIRVQWPLINDNDIASNQGAKITSYSLEIDDGLGGSFKVLVGDISSINSSNNYLLEYFTISNLVLGRIYKLRYRVFNDIGASDYSLIFEVESADVPGKPVLQVISTDANGFTTRFVPQSANGSNIFDYEFYVNGVMIFDYNYQVMGVEFYLEYSDVGVLKGTTALLNAKAKNIKGYSALSNTAYLYSGDPPAKASNPQKHFALSSTTILQLFWTATADTALPNGRVLSYSVFIKPEDGSDFSLAGTTTVPNLQIPNLLPNIKYLVKVQAENTIGFGEASDTMEFLTCSAPIEVNAPIAIATNKSTLNLSWSTNNSMNLTGLDIFGGCLLKEYRVFVSLDAFFTNQIQLSLPGLENNPAVNSITFTNNALDPTALLLSEKYFIKILLVNIDNQQSFSKMSEFILADVPGIPSASVFMKALTSKDSVAISLADPVDNGGASVFEYLVVRKALDSTEDFTVVSATGFYNSLFIDNSVLPGVKYLYKYSCRNTIGWSAFSPETLTIAAGVPEPPKKITLVNSTSLAITLSIKPSSNNNGDVITQYNLYMAPYQESTPTVFSLIDSYDSIVNDIVLSASEGVLSSNEYIFYATAVNFLGESGKSTMFVFAVSYVPAKPEPLLAVSASQSALSVQWPAAIDSQTPNLGYIIEIKELSSNKYFSITEFQNKPEVLSFTFTQVQVNTEYTLRYSVLNINGASPYSEALVMRTCSPASNLLAPELVSVSTTNIVVSWNTSTIDTGGCPIKHFTVSMKESNNPLSTWTVQQSAFTENKPLLNELNITNFTPSDIGKHFVVKYTLYIDSTNSSNSYNTFDSPQSASILLASVPSKPASAPQKGANNSNSVLSVLYNGAINDNGSALTTISLELDDGLGGAFTPIAGYLVDSMLTSIEYSNPALTQSLSYRLRYRAKNLYGFGAYSDEGRVLLASVPSKPSPVLIIDVNFQAKVLFFLSPNNGAIITSMQMQVISTSGVPTDIADCSNNSTVFSQRFCLIDYSVLRAQPFELDVQPLLVIYRLRNEVGWSVWSESNTAMENVKYPPRTPLPAITVVSQYAGSASILIPDPDLSNAVYGGSKITNITVDYKKDTDFNYSNLSGVLSNSLQREFSLNGLVVGAQYSFRYKLTNYFGTSGYSQVLTVLMQQAPDPVTITDFSFNAVTKLVDVSWDTPLFDGAAQITSYEFFVLRKNLAPNNIANFSTVAGCTALGLNLNCSFNLQILASGVFLYQPTDSVMATVLALNTKGSSAINTSLFSMVNIPGKPQALSRGNATSKSQLEVLFPQVPSDPVLYGNTSMITFILELEESASTWSVILGSITTPFLGSNYVYSDPSIVPGQKYSLRYSLQNEVGLSEYSDIFLIQAAGRPNQMLPVVVSSNVAIPVPLVVFSWSAADENGESLISYTLLIQDSNNTLDQSPECSNLLPTDSSCTIQLLSLLQAPFSLPIDSPIKAFIKAANSYGESTLSDESNIDVLLSVHPPSPPLSLVFVESGITNVSVSWTDGFNGGLMITKYTVKFKSHTSLFYEISSCSGLDANVLLNRSCTFPMSVFLLDPLLLSPGTLLSGVISAGNALDFGALSGEYISSIVVKSQPSKPEFSLFRSALTNTQQIVLSFPPEITDDSLTGYSPITKYNVEWKPATDTQFQPLVSLNNYSATYTVTAGVESGVLYSFRFTYQNVFGTSEYSNESLILAATVPGKPEPVSTSLSMTTVVFRVHPAADTGGQNVPLLVIKLFILDLNQNSIEATECDSVLLLTNHTCSIPMASLIQKYSLLQGELITAISASVNDVGQSAFSELNVSGVLVQVPPKQPTSLIFPDDIVTNQYQILINVPEVLDPFLIGHSPLTSYHVQWDQGTGDFTTLYGMHPRELRLTDFRNGLYPGRKYAFKYRVENIHGWSAFSNPAFIYTGVKPPTPTSVSTENHDSIYVKVTWDLVNTSALDIIKFEILFNDSNGNPDSELTYCNGENMLIILQHYCIVPMELLNDQLNLSTGALVQVKVRAYNLKGWSEYSELNSTGALMINKPSKPQSVLQVFQRSDMLITVFALNFISNSLQAGLLPIISYDIEWDNGIDEYASLSGFPVNSLQQQATVFDLLPGRTYKFKYRVKNLLGWSAFSEELLVEASAKPDVSQWVSSANALGKIIIRFVEPYNHGKEITNYQFAVVLKNGNYSAVTCDEPVALVVASLQCSFDMVVLRAYPFLFINYDPVVVKVRAYNANGWGKYSGASTPSAFVASPPSAPLNAPFRGERTSDTQIEVQLYDVPVSINPVLYYTVEYFDVVSSSWVVLSNSSAKLSYIMGPFSVSAGEYFRFRYKAANIVGEGQYSPEALIQAATSPSIMEPPALRHSVVNPVFIDITLKEPSNRGSPILDYEVQALSTKNEFITINCKALYCMIPNNYFKLNLINLQPGNNIFLRARARNAYGYSEFSALSSPLQVKSPPQKPFYRPSKGKLSSTSQIHVFVNEFNDYEMSGYDPIIAYEIIVILSDNNVVTLSSTLDTQAIFYNVLPNTFYSFIYRAKNNFGWGPYSDTALLDASDVPEEEAFFDPEVLITKTSLTNNSLIVYFTSSHEFNFRELFLLDSSENLLALPCTELSTNSCLFSLPLLIEAPYNLTVYDSINLQIKFNFDASFKFTPVFKSIQYQKTPDSAYAPQQGDLTSYNILDIEVPNTNYFPYNGNSDILYYTLKCDRYTVDIQSETLLEVLPLFIQESVYFPDLRKTYNTNIQNPDLRYDFNCWVNSVNAYGSSPNSKSTLIKAGSPPSVLNNLDYEYSGNNIKVSFGSPDTNGSLVNYVDIYLKAYDSRYYKVCNLIDLGANECVIPATMILDFPYNLSVRNNLDMYGVSKNIFGFSDISYSITRVPVIGMPVTPPYPPIRNTSSNAGQFILDVLPTANSVFYQVEWSTDKVNWSIGSYNSSTRHFIGGFPSEVGDAYYFRYKGINGIGSSLYSPIAEIDVAGVPDKMSPPEVFYSTVSPGMINIKLNNNNSNGADILGYNVLVFSLFGGFVPLSWCSKDPSVVLCSYHIAFFENSPFNLRPGDFLQIKSNSYNKYGLSEDSDLNEDFSIRSLPRRPSTAPYRSDIFNNYEIGIKINELTAEESGFEPIITYNIVVMYSSFNFESIIGDDEKVPFTDASKPIIYPNIAPGDQVRVMYRAKNRFGWGPYSDYGLIDFPLPE